MGHLRRSPDKHLGDNISTLRNSKMMFMSGLTRPKLAEERSRTDQVHYCTNLVMRRGGCAPMRLCTFGRDIERTSLYGLQPRYYCLQSSPQCAGDYPLSKVVSQQPEGVSQAGMVRYPHRVAVSVLAQYQSLDVGPTDAP